jgi:hypothetical protein
MKPILTCISRSNRSYRAPAIQSDQESLPPNPPAWPSGPIRCHDNFGESVNDNDTKNFGMRKIAWHDKVFSGKGFMDREKAPLTGELHGSYLMPINWRSR